MKIVAGNCFWIFFLFCVNWLYERCYDSESVFTVPQRVKVKFVGIEESKFEKCSHVTETLWGVCGRESAGECIVNWLKGSRVVMLTFVNTFLSFVF